MYRPGKAPKSIQRQSSASFDVSQLQVGNLQLQHQPNTWQFACQAGITALEKEEWEKAVRWFDKAINMNAVNPVLFDHRARAYAKLNKLDLALQDTQRIVHLIPTSALGYIRVGRLLWIKGDQDQAVEVFQAGLNSSSTTDVRYKELLQCWKGSSKAKESRGVKRQREDEDMPDAKRIELEALIGMLPVEILYQCFSFLPLVDLCKTMRVCKHWLEVCKDWKRLWSRLELNSYSRKVTNPHVGTLISRAGRHLMKLDLGSNNVVDDFVFRQVMQHRCTSLTQLRITDNNKMSTYIQSNVFKIVGPSLTHLVMRNMNNLDNTVVASILQHCPRLQHLDVSGCNIDHRCLDKQTTEMQLKTLLLKDTKISDRTVATIATFWGKCLEFLDISEVVNITSASIMALGNISTLKHLYLSKSIGARTIPMDIACGNLKSGCPNLETFHLSMCPDMTDEGLCELFTPGSKLKDVDLSRLVRMGTPSVEALFRNCLDLTMVNLAYCQRFDLGPILATLTPNPNIVKICLSHNPLFNDVDLRNLIKVFPNVVDLDLSHCPRISSTGLYHLSKKIGLQKISLDGCPDVGTSAVQTLRKMGVQVSARMDV